MRAIICFIVLLFLLIFVVFALQTPPEGSQKRIQPLSTDKIKMDWGSKAFDPFLFKGKDPLLRKQMIFDLVSGRKYVGKSIEEVVQDLGLPEYRDSTHAEYKIKTASYSWFSGADYYLRFNLKRDEVNNVEVFRECCISWWTMWLEKKGFRVD